MRRSTTGGRPAVLAAVMVVGCALGVCGCAYLNAPRIEPTGQQIFAEPVVETAPAYHDVPGATQYWDLMDVVICPRETVAPVGSEVVVLAGVRGTDQYLRTNHRVEWMLDPGGPGQFVDLGKSTPTDLLVGDFTSPRKIHNTFAVGSTSRRYLRLTRGTPAPADDVHVLRGQAWITVTSPTEGTSRVTAYAPDVYRWEHRKQTATIHWVDAQWCFPPPSINPAGTRHMFTTTVTRQVDHAPRVNWLVRYEILDGPAAGFAPDGAQTVEVPTDECGHASAEIFQEQPVPGTSRIGIQVIRPAGLEGHAATRLVVGQGTTLKTWSAPSIAVRKTGPAVASNGATLTFRIEVSNPGDLPAEDVTLTDAVPDGLTYLRSEPEGELVGGAVQWRLGTLAACETRSVEVDFRADQEGSVTNAAEATAAGGLAARDTATTAVMAPTLDVQVRGPQKPVPVGDRAAFEIVISNRGQVPTPPLLIKDRFDAGLEHAEAPSPIERTLGSLAPGESQQIGVVLRVTAPGRLNNTVEVIADDQVMATATAYVIAVQPPGLRTEPTPEKPSPAVGSVSMSVDIVGPQVGTVGEMATFAIEVANTGGQALTNVRTVCEFDPGFSPALATRGFEARPEGDPLAPFIWTAPTLPPSGTARFELQCQCSAAAVAARCRVTVTSDEGASGEDDLYVQIREAPVAAPPSLSMTLNALREPVALGKEFTYLIRVVNEGQAPDRQVTLTVVVPPELRPIKFGTVGPPSTDFEITGQTIRFDPVDTIEPDPKRPLEYRIRVQAKAAGTVQLRAELKAESLLPPLMVEWTTTVFAE